MVEEGVEGTRRKKKKRPCFPEIDLLLNGMNKITEKGILLLSLGLSDSGKLIFPSCYSPVTQGW
jgi:hypothetical protein